MPNSCKYLQVSKTFIGESRLKFKQLESRRKIGKRLCRILISNCDFLALQKTRSVHSFKRLYVFRGQRDNRHHFENMTLFRYNIISKMSVFLAAVIEAIGLYWRTQILGLSQTLLSSTQVTIAYFKTSSNLIERPLQFKKSVRKMIQSTRLLTPSAFTQPRSVIQFYLSVSNPHVFTIYTPWVTHFSHCSKLSD